MNEMLIMDKTGHTRSTWDPAVPAEVETAKSTFTALKAKGFIAYRVDPTTGEKAEIMREFDAGAAKMILSPPVVGG